jgi:hypothetical protein
MALQALESFKAFQAAVELVNSRGGVLDHRSGIGHFGIKPRGFGVLWQRLPGRESAGMYNSKNLCSAFFCRPAGTIWHALIRHALRYQNGL